MCLLYGSQDLLLNGAYTRTGFEAIRILQRTRHRRTGGYVFDAAQHGPLIGTSIRF